MYTLTDRCVDGKTNHRCNTKNRQTSTVNWGQIEEIRSIIMKSFVEKPTEENKMSIAWSLKPILILTKMFGVPTIDIEPDTGSLFCRLIALCFWGISSFLCLLLSCFLNIYRFVRYFKHKWICDGENHGLEHTNYKIAFAYVPLNCMFEFEMWFHTIFTIGVPLVFTFRCLCTRKFRKLLNSTRRIDESVVLTAKFYRKCRRDCFLLILSFLIGSDLPYLIGLHSFIIYRKYFHSFSSGA